MSAFITHINQLVIKHLPGVHSQLKHAGQKLLGPSTQLVRPEDVKTEILTRGEIVREEPKRKQRSKLPIDEEKAKEVVPYMLDILKNAAPKGYDHGWRIWDYGRTLQVYMEFKHEDDDYSKIFNKIDKGVDKYLDAYDEDELGRIVGAAWGPRGGMGTTWATINLDSDDIDTVLGSLRYFRGQEEIKHLPGANAFKTDINHLSIKHLPGIHNQQTHAGREISDERRAQLREWGRKGGKVRGAQMTSDDMKALRAKVKTESLIRSGRLGYEAVAAKYGEGYASSLFADYRRVNPSPNAQKVAGWLDRASVDYEEEVELRPNMYADFTIPMQHGMKKPMMLECDEEIWHRKDPLHGEDRPAKDKLKNIVAKEMGYDVVRVTGTQIRDGSAENIILEKIYPFQEKKDVSLFVH